MIPFRTGFFPCGTVVYTERTGIMREFHRYINDYFKYCRANGKKAAVFFHTSVLCAITAELKSAISTPYQPILDYYVPENCYYEIKLLVQCRDIGRIRENARLLTENSGKNSADGAKITISDDLTELYAGKIDICGKYNCDEAVFIFLSYKAADDFRHRIKNLSGVRILCADPILDVKLPDKPVSPRELPAIKPEKTGFSNTPLSFSADDSFTITSADRGTVPVRAAFSEFGFLSRGGEGTLYTSDKMSGKLIKLFLHKPEAGTVEKLKALMKHSGKIPYCTLPDALVYHDGECVGFVMDKLSGKDLELLFRETEGKAAELYQRYHDTGEDKLDKFYEETDRLKTKIIKDLTVGLLLLRLISFTPTDLSSSNVMVGSSGDVSFIDCDGGEFMLYPGGGSKSPFAHPNDTPDNYFKALRPYEYIDFSYAVLLWQFLFGNRHPLNQKAEYDTLEWGKMAFPLANDPYGKGICAGGCRADESSLSIWRGLNTDIRKAFTDAFTFGKTDGTKIYSERIRDIGGWIKLTGLADTQ